MKKKAADIAGQARQQTLLAAQARIHQCCGKQALRV
jgi:hypothetical protein